MPVASPPVKTHPANVAFVPQKARSETVTVGGNVDLFAWTTVSVLFEEKPKLAPEPLFGFARENSPSVQVRFPDWVNLLADHSANPKTGAFQAERDLPVKAHRRHHHLEDLFRCFHRDKPGRQILLSFLARKAIPPGRIRDPMSTLQTQVFGQ